MKILVISDTQIGSGKHLTVDRLAEQERMLHDVACLSRDHDVHVVVHLGDVFEHRHPSEEERLVFKRWAARVCMEHRLIVLQGNHDARGVVDATALDLYDEVEFIREPQVLDLGGASLACLPWTPLAHLKAAGSEDPVADAEALLLVLARQLRDECPDGVPALLAAHHWLSGAVSATGFAGVVGEPVLPVGELEAQGWSLILGGHVHRRQQLSPWTQVVGTPWVNNWGEEGQQHGVWILDTGLLASEQMRFLPLDDRTFSTVKLDCRGDAADEAIANHLAAWIECVAVDGRCDGAVVRLRVVCTERQQQSFRVAEAKELLESGGAHRVFVTFDVVKQSQQRVDGLDETVEPLEALGLWCRANELAQQDADALVELAAGYLEQVPA